MRNLSGTAGAEMFSTLVSKETLGRFLFPQGLPESIKFSTARIFEKGEEP